MRIGRGLADGPSGPVMLPGFARDWPACREWTWPWLERVAGRELVGVEISPATSSPTEFFNHRRALRMPFDQFVRLTADLGTRPSPIVYYYVSSDLLDLVPSLSGGLGPAKSAVIGVAGRSMRRAWLDPVYFIGPAGTVTHLHCDTQPGLLVQLMGAKTVRLAAPGHTAALQNWVEEGFTAEANWLGVDVETALASGQAAAIFSTFELGAGDALLLPSGWWHCVRSRTPSVSVNFGWRDRAAGRVRRVPIPGVRARR